MFLCAAPIVPCLGHLFDGTLFFKDDQGGYCTESGTKVINVNSSWLKESYTYFTHFTNKDRVSITIYCGSRNEILDEQGEQLPIIGYSCMGKTPVFSHKASGLYLFGNPWPNQIATREALPPYVIFTDGPVPLSSPCTQP
ncbi:MAG: hypothetical protein LBB19_02265 [Puniceicoccales bacterium]|nr:hypothetical protein [Puniceicoccales bacterium]